VLWEGQKLESADAAFGEMQGCLDNFMKRAAAQSGRDAKVTR
jgi:hypothetical protein